MMEETKVLNKKKVLAPRLRFNSYKDNWNLKPFSEMAEFINGKAYKQIELLNEGKYKVLRVGNLFSKSDWYYSDLELEENKYVNDGDLMYAWSASFGPHFWNGPKTIYHYHIWKVIPSKASHKKFLYYAFQNDLEKIKSQSQGGTMFHITKGNIEQRKFHFPSLPEQEKIAAFLSEVDEKIQQLNRKKQLLEQYKKGLMQQLFSGKLRFKDDNGKAYPKWEEKKLGDLAEIIGGGTPETNIPEYWDGDIQWFTPTEISEKFVSQSKRKITKAGLANSSAKLLPVGTILFTSRATIAELSFATTECTTNQGFQSLVVNKNNNSGFVYYWIKNNKKIFIRKSQGSTFLEINKNEMTKIKIQTPCLEEQKKIADFLSAIDVKINGVAAALEATTQFKKGLLQQMFV